MRYRPRTPVLSLGEGFFDPVAPAAFPARSLRFRNDEAATAVGLEELTPGQWEEHFARFLPLPANLKEPLALRYHGHQFGVYNPAIGDGRGFLFAQLADDRGRLLDLGTKGSGRDTLVARRRWAAHAEGRRARGPRHRRCSRRSACDTSSTFSLFETGEELLRGDEPSPTRSSVLVRLVALARALRHLPAPRVREERRAHAQARRLRARAPTCPRRPRRRIPYPRSSARRCAATRAPRRSGWSAGFVHGVLNTDNMNITGESFDYGP